MAQLKKILIFTSHYLPGYRAGGPIRSIANLIHALSDDFQFFVITKDRDFLQTKPYQNIATDCWVMQNKVKVYYASPESINLIKFKELMSSQHFDVLYLNSFFGYHFSILPLFINKFKIKKSMPVVLAPRGEFSQGALAIKSLKKRLFLIASKIIRLHKKLTYQASSKFEKQDILSHLNLNNVKVLIAPNLPNLSIQASDQPPYSGVLKIISVSRISPMKNLTFALEALKNIKGPVEFSVYGLIDDHEYWKSCQQIIERLPSNISVNVYGALDNSSVLDKLSQHHLFFLPTQGENYGHAIVEAMMAGLPVLISQATPWRNLTENEVGWDLSLNEKELFVEAIGRFRSNMAQGLFLDRQKISNWIKNKIKDSSTIRLNIELFESAINNDS